jgi:hypothetical protein
VLDSSIYGHFDTLIPEGGPEGITNVGGSPIFGDTFSLSIFLLEPGTNIISDHLFSVRGSRSHPGGDTLFFASDPSSDPLIGTVYSGDPRFAIEETGALQDVTGIVALQNGGQGVFGGGTIQIQSDVDAVPEPATLTLLCVGALGMAGYGWRRRKQTVAE